ncbi:MAG: NAD-dependent epimerase/dehydratase family protein [Anaerolineales bacterium]|nr:NAD-dependent epimerase/dehydratase family protein [Anaerolineales bacterium]
MAQKVLFIGGTGVNSSACSALAVETGLDLYLFNRGNSIRPAPTGTTVFQGDLNNPSQIKEVLENNSFDVVVNWIAFHPEDIERDIRLFNGKIGQYIFISSASAYQKPIKQLPITELTPLENPYWEYSREKKACEEVLFQAFQKQNFPITVVRPSHTYDKTLLPLPGGYTTLDRILNGKKVVIHGDGTSLWVLTHHKDFAVGFTGLLGNPQALGEAYQITSDFLLTWNDIFGVIAETAGAKLNPVYVPSTVIAQYDPGWGASLLGDKAHSVIFDNSKIKNLVPDFNAVIPYQDGCKETINWYKNNPSHQIINHHLSATIDKLVSIYD